MKKLLFVPLLLLAVFARAQYVNIPDTAFASYLTSVYPSAMSGSMMDTTDPSILSATLLKSYSPYIRNLDGIQYFNSLVSLTCECANLDTIPGLPPSVRYLAVTGQFTVLPELPPNLRELFCSSSELSQLPAFPASLNNLDLRENPKLFCLPELKNDTFSIMVRYGTGITCLPNMPLYVISSDGSDLLPVCTILSGCPIGDNISGQLHEDTSATCALDSLNPGVGISYLKVKKLNHGVLVQQRYSSAGGYYSFDGAIGDSITILVDTPYIPLMVSCPLTGVRSAHLTPADSVFSHLDFGLQCTGVDLGVLNIATGKFKNNFTSRVYINAGDLSHFFNLHCADGVSGSVTTTLSGSVSYVEPVHGALTPTSISGSTLTYSIADFGAINPQQAFNIVLKTDSLAALGSNICINVSVSAAADVNPVNDTLTFCGTVVNSYDPNEKTAYPHARIGPGEWITYKVDFQNTGTDTAYRILIRDTLDANLDPGSFSFLGSSHQQPEVILDKNAILFHFAQINLPDSVHDEPNSHGWIQYKVKTLPTFPATAIIYNKASIYFDSNEPIVTNTTRHAQFMLSVKDAAQAASLQLYPNPVEGLLTVEVPEAGTLRTYNIVGSLVSDNRLRSGSNTISLPKTLPAGLYIYRFDAASGTVMQGKLEKK